MCVDSLESFFIFSRGSRCHPPGGEWISPHSEERNDHLLAKMDLGCCIKSKNVVSSRGRGPSLMAFLSKRTAKVWRLFKPPKAWWVFFRHPRRPICQRVLLSFESGRKGSQFVSSTKRWGNFFWLPSQPSVKLKSPSVESGRKGSASLSCTKAFLNFSPSFFRAKTLSR